jgi:hypothetical protein
MKTYSLSNLLFAILLFLGMSCVDNNPTPIEPQKIFLETINVQEDSDLLNLIADLYNKGGKPTGRTLNTNFGEINLNEALKLNDTAFNRTRYTLGLIPQEKDFSFENVIISVRQEGIFHYILRYEPDSTWLFENPYTPNWSHFTGKVAQLNFDREVVSEATLQNGVSLEKKNDDGRTNDCYDCTWEVKSSSTTGLPYIEIDCGGGGQYLAFLRSSNCAGGGGDGGGLSGGGSGSGSGGGSSGGGGDGGGGSSGGGGGGSYTGSGGYGGSINPVGLLPQYKVCPGDDAQVPIDYPCPGDPVDDELPVDEWPIDVLVNAPPVGTIISDINKYLKCFDTNSGAQFTIYVDQPIPNSRDAYDRNGLDVDVGHTFIGIKQGAQTRLLGFYPATGVAPWDPSEPSALVDDSAHPYDVKIDISITASQLSTILNQIKNRAGTYNLNSYNCTDFALGACASAGLSLPDTSGNWPGGGGTNPGDLGEDIRLMNSSSTITVSKNSGTAPSNSGTCN